MQNIKLNELFPHPDNPRNDLGDLSELSESIKAQGILQNLTVVKRGGKKTGYTVIIGHRRHAAAKLAKLAEAPCVVTTMDEKTQIATMLLENLQRSDLTVPEQARGFQMMMDLGETVQTIAEKTGFSEKTVRKRVFVASLDAEKAALAHGRGATLEDFIRLQQIESEEKRDEVLESLGTGDFNQALSTATSEELRDRIARKIIEHVEKFASPSEKCSHELSDYNYYGRCYYGSYEESGNLNIDIPEEFSHDEFVYTVGLHYLQVSKRQQKAAGQKKMSELPPEEQEARRERRRKYKELKELSETAHSLRLDFVMSFSRKTLKPAELEALAELSFAAVCLGYKLDLSLFKKVMGVEAETPWNMSFAQKRELANPVTAPKLLLSSLYSTFKDSPDNKYYYASGEAAQVKIGCFRENEKLDAIYDCLCSLGYVKSGDERMLQLEEYYLRDKQRHVGYSPVVK